MAELVEKISLLHQQLQQCTQPTKESLALFDEYTNAVKEYRLRRQAIREAQEMIHNGRDAVIAQEYDLPE
jgi:hypothetical protein